MKQLKKTIAVIAALTSVFAATSAQAQYHSTLRLAPLQERSYTYEAGRGEVFRVIISGDGRTDVDLYIKDEFNRTVCSETGTTDDEACIVRATRGGKYTIGIENIDISPNFVHLWLD